jgi:hypothetical protein
MKLKELLDAGVLTQAEFDARATVTGATMTWRSALAAAEPAPAVPSEGGASAMVGSVAAGVAVVAARRAVVGIALTFSESAAVEDAGKRLPWGVPAVRPGT